MTAPADTALPVRYCHGCDQYDDHPRVRVIVTDLDPATDRLYHYDCLHVDGALTELPAVLQPGFDATAEGKRGQDVRDVMAAHALTIEEAPADTPEGA